MVPIIPYLGLMLLRRQRQAVPVIIGMAIGWAWGWYDAAVTSYPYVFYSPPAGNRGSAIDMIKIIVATLVVTVAGGLWLRWRMRVKGALPQVGEHWYLPQWLPAFLVILPFVVLAGFGARSHFQLDYAKAQYAQLTLHWVYWYIGGPAIALAGAGAAALSYGCLRGRYPAWALPLTMFSWSIVAFLYRPGSPRTSHGPAAAWCRWCCPASSCSRPGRWPGLAARSAAGRSLAPPGSPRASPCWPPG